jgi:hypothetical protein
MLTCGQGNDKKGRDKISVTVHVQHKVLHLHIADTGRIRYFRYLDFVAQKWAEGREKVYTDVHGCTVRPLSSPTFSR